MSRYIFSKNNRWYISLVFDPSDSQLQEKASYYTLTDDITGPYYATGTSDSVSIGVSYAPVVEPVGVSLRAGVIVSDSGTLKVQPLSFDGTVPSDSGALQGLSDSSLLIFNTGHDEPDYGGSGGTDVVGYTYDFRNFQSGNSWASNGYTMTSSDSLIASNGILNIPYSKSVLGTPFTPSNNYMLSVILKLNIGSGLASQKMLVGCADGGLGAYTPYWIYSTNGEERPILYADYDAGKWHRIDIFKFFGTYLYRYNKQVKVSSDVEYWSEAAPTGLFMRNTTEYYYSIDVAFLGYLDHFPSSSELQLLDISVDSIYNQLS